MNNSRKSKRKIQKSIRKEKQAELEKRLSEVDQLIQEKQFSNAINELEKIVQEAKQNIYTMYIIDRVERRITHNDSLRLEKEKRKIDTIKKMVLDLGIKFPRLQIVEIRERTGIKNEKLIITTILDMIKNNEIYADYFESSRSIAFNQQANIDEIDKLMEAYKKWEEKTVNKKN